MIKKLFIYWDTGFDKASNTVKKWLLSWKLKNPTWEIKFSEVAFHLSSS